MKKKNNIKKNSLKEFELVQDLIFHIMKTQKKCWHEAIMELMGLMIFIAQKELNKTEVKKYIKQVFKI